MDAAQATAEHYARLPRRRTAAGALITDQRGFVLLVEPTYKPNWEIPGGTVEAGEDPPVACARECREELGRPVAVGRLLVLDHRSEPPPRGDSTAFIYDGGCLDTLAVLTLPAAELRSHRFVDPGELDTRVAARLARRVRAALAGRLDGRLVELCDGRLRAPGTAEPLQWEPLHADADAAEPGCPPGVEGGPARAR